MKTKNLVFIFSLIFLLLVITPLSQAAGEDIQVVLEQPAVYSVTMGDTLDYNLRITLPKDYESKYKNFVVTVMFDTNLTTADPVLGNIQPAKDKLLLTKSTLSNQSRDIVTLSVNDLSYLKGAQNLNVGIKARVKNTIKPGENFKNSFVLTFIDKSGNEDSSQKDLISNTVTSAGEVTINEVLANSKKIEGKTEPSIPLKVFAGEKQIGEGSSDAQGNYSIAIIPQEGKASIKVVGYVSLNGKTEEISKEITVTSPAATQPPVDTGVDLIGSVDTLGSYRDVLSDHITAAKELNLSFASTEEQAGMKAAIANGEYMEIKSNVSQDEVENSTKNLSNWISAIRKPYMSGYTETRFGPANSVKRSEVAVIFKRLMTGNDRGSNYSSFNDIKDSAWYAESVAFVENMELMSGYRGNLFKPDNPITRAEFAAIIAKYENLPVRTSSMNFRDVDRNHWAKDIIGSVASAGLMQGTDKGNFNPNKAITRTELTVVVNKILDRQPNREFIDKYSTNPFTDVNKNFWGYYEIMEATGN